jgi:hypothetical protein
MPTQFKVNVTLDFRGQIGKQCCRTRASGSLATKRGRIGSLSGWGHPEPDHAVLVVAFHMRDMQPRFVVKGNINKGELRRGVSEYENQRVEHIT